MGICGITLSSGAPVSMRRAQLLACGVGFVLAGPNVGCQFEVLPAGSPLATDAAVPNAPTGEAVGSGGASGDGGALGSVGASGGGVLGGDDGTDVAPSGGGGMSSPVGAPDAGTVCTPPQPAVCNPLLNDGCAPELGMHCAVDTLAPTLAGYCTFSAPADAGACLNTGVTNSCPPTTTCVEGECRPLCFCDTDCEGGCCAISVGNTGFKVCGDC